MSVTPTISNVAVTNIAGTAATPWSVATITTSTVTNPTTGYSANVEDVFYQLTPAGSPTYTGAIQADFSVASDGSLTAIDQVFYQPDGAKTAVFDGSEASNPIFLTTSTTPANPGYAYTEYSYSSTGTLTQVVAADSNGKVYVGV